MTKEAVNRDDEIVGRLCQTPWRFAETPYNNLVLSLIGHSAFGLRHLIPTGPGWERLPEGGLCETRPAVAQPRVVAAPRAMLAQGRDLDLSN